MKIPVGPAIALAGIAIVAAMIAGGWWWWQQNAEQLKEAATKAYSDGQRDGAGLDEPGCLDRAVARHRLTDNQTILETVRTSVTLRGCLDASKADAKFCAGVPPKDEVLSFATWATQTCAKHGLTDAYCNQLMGQVSVVLRIAGKSRKAMMTMVRVLFDLCVLIPIAMVAYAWLGTTTYAPGQTPEGRFPIVVHAAGSNPPDYRLIDLRELPKLRSAEPAITPSLPEPQGAFELPPRKNVTPTVRFTVSATAEGQRIMVIHKTGDYDFESLYLVSGTSVQAERLFAGHAMSMLFAAVIGFAGAEALFLLLRFAYRRLSGRRRSGAATP